jgi:hypothetical protein
MIELSFEPDEQTGRNSDRALRWRIDLAHLAEDLYRMPVMLTVGGTVLIPGFRIPIFSLATDGLDALEHLTDGTSKRMNFPDDVSLEVSRVGDTLQMATGPQGAIRATASYRELLEAWRQFTRSTLNYLFERRPRLKSHTEIKKWMDNHTDL